MKQIVHTTGVKVQEKEREGIHSASEVEVELLRKGLMTAKEEIAILKVCFKVTWNLIPY